jgi:PAS domain S-box-containing protein
MNLSRKPVGLLVLLTFALLTVLFFALGIQPAFENTVFLGFLLIVFQSIIPLLASYVAAASYLKRRLPQLLILGCALLAYGMFNLIVTLGVLLVNTPDWANFNVTLHNSGLLIFAIVTLASSIVAMNWHPGIGFKVHGKKWVVLSAYSLVVISVAVFALSTLFGFVPPFVVLGEFTVLRQWVLGLTIVFLLGSSFVLMTLYFESKLDLVYWFALGLAMTSIGVISILIQPALGTPLSWIGRAAQYVGCIFLLIAVLNKSAAGGTTDGWAEAFKRDRRQFNLLFSNMNSGFAYHKIVLDDKGKPIDYIFLEVNKAFEALTGIKRANALGKNATKVIPGLEKDPADWIGIYGKVAIIKEPLTFEMYSEALQKWYLVSAYSPEKGYFATIFDDITERKKGEEELKRSEEQARQRAEELRKLMDIIPAAVWLSRDPECRVIVGNQAANTFYEAEREENVSAGSVSGVAQDTTRRFFRNGKELMPQELPMQAAAAKNIEIKNSELEVIVPSGRKITILGNARPLLDNVGKVRGCLGTFVDITERKQIEEALKESERLYRTLFDNSTDGFQLVEPIYDNNGKAVDYRFLKVNKAFESQTGLKINDIVGKRAKEIAPDIEQAWVETHSYVAKTGKTIHTELYNDYSKRWYDLHYFPYTKGTVGVLLRDITERKKADEALRRREEEFRALVQSSSDVVYRMSPDWKEMRQLGGANFIPDTNEPSRNWTDKYIHPDDQKYVWAAIQHAIKTKSIFELEHRVIRVDGSLGWTFSRAIPLLDNEGNIIEWLGTAKDVTQRKNMEQQLQEKERLAAIGATAGMVGHDIRNPLQGMTSDVYLAKTELASLPESEEKKNVLESLDEIQNNINYVNKIVADLQDFARPLNPRTQETNIKTVFNEILAKNGYPKNVKVTVEVEEKAERIMADPHYLKRIAANLTLNAVQAMPEGGKLTIRAYAEKKTNDIVITVADTGSGIPEDVKPKLFTPMMTTKSKGQGFGLAVVKRMTEGLGGAVTFESTEGKGTTFTVRLPPPKS